MPTGSQLTVVVLGDTHAPARMREVPGAVLRLLPGADLILHTGDVCRPWLLDELSGWAPVHVAMGNCDPPEVRAWGATDTVELELEGVGLAMLHDSGRGPGRAERMRARFPGAGVVVFGHSHAPLVERHGDLLLLNPGSPTDRRRAPHHTVALLRIAGGRAEAEVVQLD